MFVMRDGSIVRGKLYHISADGSSISFDPQGGTSTADRRTVLSSQTARIYINAPKARTLYASVLNRAAASGSEVATSGAGGRAITVQANQPWTDTGITVRAGQMVTFTTTGEIDVWPGRASAASANGVAVSGVDTGKYPVPAMALGGLVAKVGNNGAPFPIGATSQSIRMPANGRLFLGINDDNHADNSGSFSVVVRRVGR